MKICLVPFPIVLDSADTDVPKQLYPYLPLGLLTLSTLLEQAGHEVTILDLAWEAQSSSIANSTWHNPENVAHLIQSKAPDLVGFSTIFSSYPLILNWAENFRLLSPTTPILLGGPQATATDEQTLRVFPWINMVLRGEAENSIIPLVSCLQFGGDLASVPGLTWRNGNQVIRNPDAPIMMDLDTLPIPAYHLYPMERLSQYYNTRIGLYHHNFPIEAGRGCPFNCSFCSTSGFFQRRYRTKSVDRLIREMVTLNEQHSLVHFDLSHDLFTYNRAYVLEFCDTLRKKGLQKTLKWECYSRTDSVDRKVLEEMATAGCSGIFYGIETGSQRMQRLIGKKLDIQQARSVVKNTISLGMHASTSFICGFPQEHQEDLAATFALAMDMICMGVEQMVLLPLFPLVSSELYRTFAETLRYDGPWSSDILYGCLSEDDKKQVRNWPQLFAGFYHYETPFLNSDMLRALLRVINRYPRLLAALSVKNIDVMSVFERWPEWYHNRINTVSENYYLKQEFFLDFFQFLRETLSNNVNMTPYLRDIIDFHAFYEKVAFASADHPIITANFNSDVLVLVSHLVEGRPLPDEALQPITYIFGKTNGKIIAKPLLPALEELFRNTSSKNKE